MTIDHVFIISKAGCLLYYYDRNKRQISEPIVETFSYPLPLSLKLFDGRIVVDFNETEKVKYGYALRKVNGKPLVDCNKVPKRREDGEDDLIPIFDYIEDENHFPIKCEFEKKKMSANERLIFAGMFQGISAIAQQIAPCKKSSGINQIVTSTYTLFCFQPLTGIKFIAITDKSQTEHSMQPFFRHVYELYADYVLKDPFHILEMPIKSILFSEYFNKFISQIQQEQLALQMHHRSD
ncbi:hypothetical protein SNEBB_011359 [Seison nebaliae]|nr:hypothetical protein SNEBB_011359 [Seison nebaliae]